MSKTYDHFNETELVGIARCLGFSDFTNGHEGRMRQYVLVEVLEAYSGSGKTPNPDRLYPALADKICSTYESAFEEGE